VRREASRVRDGGLERHALPSPFLYLGDEPDPVGGWGEITLNGFLDFAATETAGADSNAFRLTVDQCPDWLEVGLEGPLGLVIGVTDVMAGLATFAAEIACKCHGYTPSSSRTDARSQRLKCTIGSLVFTSRIDGLSMGVSVLRECDLR
jgi:hypothetical protein